MFLPAARCPAWPFWRIPGTSGLLIESASAPEEMSSSAQAGFGHALLD
jgi:hypothetical protein